MECLARVGKVINDSAQAFEECEEGGADGDNDGAKKDDNTIVLNDKNEKEVSVENERLFVVDIFVASVITAWNSSRITRVLINFPKVVSPKCPIYTSQ